MKSVHTDLSNPVLTAQSERLRQRIRYSTLTHGCIVADVLEPSIAEWLLPEDSALWARLVANINWLLPRIGPILTLDPTAEDLHQDVQILRAPCFALKIALLCASLGAECVLVSDQAAEHSRRISELGLPTLLLAGGEASVLATLLKLCVSLEKEERHSGLDVLVLDRAAQEHAHSLCTLFFAGGVLIADASAESLQHTLVRFQEYEADRQDPDALLRVRAAFRKFASTLERLGV